MEHYRFPYIFFDYMFRYLGLMPSYCYSADALATKIITFFPDNGNKGVPSHQAVVFLMDAATGSPLAVCPLIGIKLISMLKTLWQYMMYTINMEVVCSEHYDSL